VQVNQCTIFQCGRGVRIRNGKAAEYEYRNVIVDNDIVQCGVGVDVANRWYESDLIRSNRISASGTAMRIDGRQSDPGSLHPRILSNTMQNSTGFVAVELQDCSARIVNNTIAFTTDLGAVPASIGVFPDPGGSGGEAIVIANNLLFSPVYPVGTQTFDPPEILVQGATFAGTLTVDSNDFDSSGAGVLITPLVGTLSGNVAVANPAFASPPADLHLTAASPSVANAGNQAFVVPGATATILLPNGVGVPASCALDVDLDPRTRAETDLGVELHRGSDQFMGIVTRLSTTTFGSNPAPDAFGNVPVDSAGNAAVDLLLAAPVGSLYAVYLGAALPMGPELQHIDVPGIGSLAIDPSAGFGTTVLSGATTSDPEPLTLNLGQVSPAFTEAEMYLQALVLLPNGVLTFTNRIRLDVDGI
jgi:hypothetical protein